MNEEELELFMSNLARSMNVIPSLRTKMSPDTLTGSEREAYYNIFQSPRFNRMSQEKKDEYVREIGQRPMHNLLQDSPGSYLDLMKTIYEEWPDKARPDLPFPDVQAFLNTGLGLLERGEISQEELEEGFAPWIEQLGDAPTTLKGYYRLPLSETHRIDPSVLIPGSEGEVRIGHYPRRGTEPEHTQRSLEDTLGHETFHALSTRGHGYNIGVSPQVAFAAAVRTLGRRAEGEGDWLGDEGGKAVDFTLLGPLSAEGAMNSLVEIGRKNYAKANPSSREMDEDLIGKELEAVFTRLLALPAYKNHPIRAKGLGRWTGDKK
jgi:hypothetical protein